MTQQRSSLISLLDDYANTFNHGKSVELHKKLINACLSSEENPEIFAAIAAEVWDRYSCVDVEIVIMILRRWLDLEPDSPTAKRAAGSYMLAHGPDWDDEGRALLDATQADPHHIQSG